MGQAHGAGPPQIAMLCRLISSIAATAAAAALLLGNAFRRPSTFTQLPAAPGPPPMYSASASPPSLSSSLSRGRDFFFFKVVTEDEVPDEVLAPEVVEPVVRVGGPGEYMAAADPGRGTGIGKSSGLM